MRAILKKSLHPLSHCLVRRFRRKGDWPIFFPEQRRYCVC